SGGEPDGRELPGGQTGDAEADAAVAVASVVAVAVRRAAVPGVDFPRATAVDTGAAFRANRIFYKSCLIFPLPVATPLPDVAVHVVQLPRVGPEALDRRREGEAVVPLDAVGRLRQLPAERSVRDVGVPAQVFLVVAEEVARGGAGAAGIFP